MQGGYVTVGMPLGRLWPLLRRHGISFSPRAIGRALFLLQGGFWASFLARLEAWRWGVPRRAPPRAPLLIVGHWRSGTTLLHQLLAQDPTFVAPTLLQCAWPGAPRAAERYVRPLLRRLMTGHRPMDNVRIAVDEPQEDEWATFRLTGLSPLARVVFPRDGRYFLLDDDAFALAGEERARWAAGFLRFLGDVAGDSGRTLLLKNPFHTLRIDLVAGLLPDARFVHIVRDPRRVVPSTIHLWSVLLRQNALRRGWRPPTVEEAALGLARTLDRAEEQLARLPSGRRASLRFEDLEADPLGAVDRLYGDLGEALTPARRRPIEEWVAATRGYRKNDYPADPERDARVAVILNKHMKKYGY